MRERLYSLDLLRGLDMVLLTVIGPLQNGWRLSWGIPAGVTNQFSHFWSGFTLWDLIQPLFIFMCGAAVPFALGKRMEDGRAGRTYWRHVFGRVGLLYLLGFAASGAVFKLDLTRVAPIGNTLQLIAVGYLLAALVYPLKSRWVRCLPFAAYLAVYGVILCICGDWTSDGTAGIRFDQWLLSHVYPPDSPVLTHHNGYSKFLTLPVYGFLTVAGLEATLVLRGGLSPWRKAGTLFAAGAALAALGWVLVPVIPMIKHIYSPSFTLAAVGYALLLLAALYVLTDIWKFRRGLGFFILYGQVSLAAYMLYTLFAPALRVTAEVVTVGVPRLWPSAGPFAATVALVVFQTWILWLWRQMKENKRQ